MPKQKNAGEKNVLSLKVIARASIPILKRNGVLKAGIFGSYARGEAKRRSDIDFLVQLKGHKSLLDEVKLERELKEHLGKKVDIVSYKSISPYLRERILKEEVRIL